MPAQSAARDLYAADTGLPPAGAKVCVSGFSKKGHEEAAALLGLHGLVASSFLAGADAILVPSAPSREVVADAQKSGRKVLVLEDLKNLTAPAKRRTAIEVTDDFVRILDVTLPRRPAGERQVPHPSCFRHLCLDPVFLRTARSVAIAARDALPCALEGDTATAKTTSVLWVASLLRQGAVRLNLNGQSDTGELVGRFVPASDWEEHATLADNEKAPFLSWRFWEGFIPQALRNGWWVVLDEMNLAEPQVLERLNPVLETPPSLVLGENDGTMFGPGGDVAVAPDFRMFATMNPAEYAGRTVLSPAFRDRWSLWSFVDTPAESEFRSMLHCLVHGTQPEFALDGTLWRAPDTEPIYPILAGHSGIDALLAAIASFHCAVAAASGNGGGAEMGRVRRERYVFTRRTLLAMMKLFANAVSRGGDPERAARDAIEQIYVGRVQAGSDRQAVRAALRTVGLAK